MQKFLLACACLLFLVPVSPVLAAPHLYSFKALPPIHELGVATAKPNGLSPDQVKAAYNLPATGGMGTIAVIEAFHDKTLASDLNAFSAAYKLPLCNATSTCLEVHRMSTKSKSNSSWTLESSLDAEWAHAIAPKAKILVVEAASGSGANMLAAIDYARKRKDVVAVAMSWGGAEFPEETTLNNHFASSTAVFFASAGDHGSGVSWPAVSPYVVAVGGTSLAFTTSTVKETAWEGSGGGVSAFEKQPTYQASYSIKKAGGMRAVPDVSYNADPKTGFSIYATKPTKTTTTKGKMKAKGSWYVVGGTSAGAPQWAAIHSLGLTATNERFYADKASTSTTKYFRDIVSGSNGTCTYFCDAHKHYDYVTGLGSPLTVKF